MKKTVLFGAGQAGAMAARLLGGDHAAVCFADNAPEKRGGSLAGLPIVSPEEALALGPDCVCLCVLDAERASQMEAQLRALGYAGPLLRAGELAPFDARAATMRLLAEQILELGIPGDAAELGVFRGEFAALINAALPERRLHLFDTFEGFHAEDVEEERRLGLSRARTGDFADTDVEAVLRRLPHPERAVIHAGRFPATFEPCVELSFPSSRWMQTSMHPLQPPCHSFGSASRRAARCLSTTSMDSSTPERAGQYANSAQSAVFSPRPCAICTAACS